MWVEVFSKPYQKWITVDPFDPSYVLPATVTWSHQHLTVRTSSSTLLHSKRMATLAMSPLATPRPSTRVYRVCVPDDACKGR